MQEAFCYLYISSLHDPRFGATNLHFGLFFAKGEGEPSSAPSNNFCHGYFDETGETDTPPWILALYRLFVCLIDTFYVCLK